MRFLNIPDILLSSPPANSPSSIISDSVLFSSIPMVLENYRIIARVWEWFENIRKALRVSRELNSKEAGEAQDIGITGIKLNRTLSDIIEEGEFADGELKRISGIFRKRIEDHRSELLSPVTGKDGKTVNIVRHNGIEESGHRWSRMHIRRRTGRSQTTREMAMYGALTAVLKYHWITCDLPDCCIEISYRFNNHQV